MLNLDEIKKRVKILNVGNSDKEWAADKILQLVSKIESMGKPHMEFGKMMFKDLHEAIAEADEVMKNE